MNLKIINLAPPFFLLIKGSRWVYFRVASAKGMMGRLGSLWSELTESTLPTRWTVRLLMLYSFRKEKLLQSKHSGTRPYSHLGNTITLLLRPLFLAARKNGHKFSCKKRPSLLRSPIKTAIFFCPLVTVLTGLHCKPEIEQSKLDLKNLDHV